MILIQILTLALWPAFKEIRLQLLQEYPHAFSSTLQEETLLSDAAWQERINPDKTVFIGAWHNQKLVAIAGAQWQQGNRIKHRAQLISIGALKEYINGPEILENLLQELFKELIKRGIVQLTTTLNTNATTALSVYEKLGFQQIGILPKEIFDNGEYRDRILLLKILS